MSEWSDFLEAIDDEITAFVAALREAFEIVGEKIKEIRDEIFEREVEIFDIRTGRKEWRAAAALAGQRAAARAQAYDKQMQLDKARRVLRRRKRLHNDGGLPDW